MDAALAQFNRAIDVMTANLFELENDPNRKVLEGASLTGITASRWAEARQSLAQLWQWFTMFKDLVERASTLRGTRGRPGPAQLAELDRLLGGPSIELSAEQIPLSRRALLGPAQTTISCRPDELLARMSEAFDQAKAVVAATGEAWTHLLPRLQSDETALSDMEREAASLGERSVPELAGIRGRLDGLETSLATDPLSIASGTVDAVEASIAAVRRDLDELIRLRADLTAQLDQARALLAQLEQVMAEGRAANDEVRIKIVSPSVPAPATPDPELGARLERAAALAGHQQWRAARHQLTEWTTQVNGLLAEAQRIASANRAPIAERNELRGRLEAYRAKANRLGRVEDAALADTYEQAHRLLFSAPIDLGAAAELVARYQQALAGPRPNEVPS